VVQVTEGTQAWTFTCDYQPQFTPGTATQIHPPQGTRCIVVFPANGDHTPAIVMFYGWPT
jgi:hypothetical protein